MFIEIVNPHGRHQTSYKGLVNTTHIQQVKIIRAKNDSYEVHINLVDSPSIELLGTKEECEETYNMLQRILEKHEMFMSKQLVFPPPLPSSKSSAEESEEVENP